MRYLAVILGGVLAAGACTGKTERKAAPQVEPAPVVTPPTPVVVTPPTPVVVAEPPPEPVVVAEPPPEPVVVAEPPPEPVVVAEPPPEPVVVAEPTPELVPVEPEPAGPVLAAAGDWPKGKTKAIGKPELELLKAKLTEVHKAKARIRGSLAHETLAGVPVGFAVYEVTLFDACVGKATDPKAAKRECRAELRGDEEQGEPSQLLCTEQYVVRVSSFAPLEIGAPEGVTKGCSLKVQKIAAHDYDGDGEDEVLIDAIGTTSTPEYRTAGEDAFMRLFRVMRLDGTTQLSIDVEWQYSEGISRGEAQRFAVRDEQGKGRLDLIVSYLDFTLNDEPATPWILWPTPGPDGLPEGDELGAVHTEMWPYDAAKDEWVKPPRAE